MNQPTTPNTVEDFLPLPKAKGIVEYGIPGEIYSRMEDGYTADQVRAAILADRAQRPTVAGSVDTPELRRLVNDYKNECALVQGHGVPSWRRLIAHINARLAPAAPSGEAVLFTRQRDLDRLSNHGVLVFPDSGEDWNIPLYTHPAPSSPTAPGLPAQAVPELAKWIDDAKGKDPFTDDLIAEIEQLRAQVAANKQEGK